jgi:hypothetical protein
MKNQTAMVPQMMPPVPLFRYQLRCCDIEFCESYPLRRPGQLASKVHSQVACRMVTNPTMLTNLKLRWDWCQLACFVLIHCDAIHTLNS